MAYKLLENGFVDTINGMSVPFSKGNRHYEKIIKELVNKGLVVLDAGGNPIFFPNDVDLISSKDLIISDLKKQAKNEIDREADIAKNRHVNRTSGQIKKYTKSIDKESRNGKSKIKSAEDKDEIEAAKIYTLTVLKAI